MLKLKKFFAQDTGAVTVDWVVLTAALLVLGLAVTQTIAEPTKGLATDIGDTVAAMEVEVF